MKKQKINFSAGIASRTLIILAIVVLIMIGVVYWVTTLALKSKKVEENPTSEVPEEVLPVYEAQIGDYAFSFQSATDYGKVLPSYLSRSPKTQPDLTTTERFIEVTVVAQNKGKASTGKNSWDLGNIVDSEGRIFEPITERAYSWLPRPDKCGSVLFPEFEPTPCVRIYEVSRVSEGLKVSVLATLPNSSKAEKQLLDLDVTP